jgi:acetyl-CoA C-acetyltransferase
VGLGTSTQRCEDPRQAREPLDLLLQAVGAAVMDTGADEVLQGCGYIAVPQGRWNYANPAGAVARRFGAQDPCTVLSKVGVLQQTLVAEACARIARGQAHTTLVCGADAGYRLQRAQALGVQLQHQQQTDEPHLRMVPAEEMRHPAELDAELVMPVGIYAMMESALRFRHGWSVEQHRDQLARMYARFATIASNNPSAWLRTAPDESLIRGAQGNAMTAFPYTRLHCSNWSVDQAAALLFCSEARARELGIPRDRWIYAVGAVESNHMVPMSARERIEECPGARIGGRVLLETAGLRADSIDLVDLYSCFPFAISSFADALGLPLDRDLTVTGGMSFAGGPWNNYFLQATVRAAELMRQGRGDTALLSCVSGVVTKQGFSLYAREPLRDFFHTDVTEDVIRSTPERQVLRGYSGPGTIAGCTVLHLRGRAPRAVALIDTPDGRRAVVTGDSPSMVEGFEQEEFVGRKLRAAGGRIEAAA